MLVGPHEYHWYELVATHTNRKRERVKVGQSFFFLYNFCTHSTFVHNSLVLLKCKACESMSERLTVAALARTAQSCWLTHCPRNCPGPVHQPWLHAVHTQLVWIRLVAAEAKHTVTHGFSLCIIKQKIHLKLRGKCLHIQGYPLTK